MDIILEKANSDKEFFLIHGYTGGPTDFNGLAEYLSKSFQSSVKIITLLGHGQNIQALDKYDTNDFLKQAERELKNDLSKGKKIILGGVSFGAQLALILASRHKVLGVFHIGIPYKMKFPFNVPGLSFLGIFKKYWKKKFSQEELAFRKKAQAIYYPDMHIRSLSVLKKANKEVSKSLVKITCPCLMIHSSKDPVSQSKALKIIEKKISSPIKKSIILNNRPGNHNIFFSPLREEINATVRDFIKKNNIFENHLPIQKVAAIVPSFNEAERISGVLKVLRESKCIDEIIAVDDGSSDETEKRVREFSGVLYLRNKKNRGKSYSLSRGAAATKADVLFFCDADLRGFTSSAVEAIVTPVLRGEVDMFIGVRNNIMQKSFLPFAKLSGERALKRSLWEKLPGFYKHRYRVEVGLNYYSRFLGKGFDYKIFDYFQTVKEKKYGFLKGMYLRWGMNFDVMSAFFRAQFCDYFLFKIKKH